MSQFFFEKPKMTKGHTKNNMAKICPVGFFAYTVRPGDTISSLARRLGVDEGLIIANNPQITDPSLIRVGMVLCLPTPVFFPCCAVLKPAGSAPASAAGSALIRQLGNGRQAVSFLAVGLPEPSTFGNFNAYEAFVEIREIGGFADILIRLPDEMNTWAGTVELIRAVLFAGAELSVRPVNTKTGTSGAPVLLGNLLRCAKHGKKMLTVKGIN